MFLRFCVSNIYLPTVVIKKRIVPHELPQRVRVMAAYVGVCVYPFMALPLRCGRLLKASLHCPQVYSILKKDRL